MTDDQLGLFNYPVAPHNGTDTSLDAAESIKPHINRLGSMVLKAIREMPAGLTCQEVEHILSLSSGTATARINELANSQPPFIVQLKDQSGNYIRRKNISGRFAAVWFANPEA